MILIPERFGCGIKLPFDEVLRHIAATGTSLSGHAYARATPGIVSSIDKVFRVGRSYQSFARAALLHCSADLVGGGAKAEAAEVCFEFGPDLTLTDREALSVAVFAQARQLGIEVGKCHSTFGPVTALTVSVRGKRLVEFVSPSANGDIVMVGRLGGMQMLYADTIEEGGDSDLLLDNLNSSNVDAALTCHHRISAVCDISGYGIAGATVELSVGLGRQIEIDMEDLTFVAGFQSNAFECLSADFGTFEISVNDSRYRLSLTTRELAGPLLVAGANGAELVRALKDAGAEDASVVGTYRPGRGVTFQ